MRRGMVVREQEVGFVVRIPTGKLERVAVTCIIIYQRVFNAINLELTLQ